ncbi:MAG: response regulator transcription factor [Deltaproteobacteria bacterium]|jgi:two-component system, LytTR family, response regulator|nr:response regulator transcription factor [Deltaproteobacteria bacterium]MBT4525677.1 response regulator transcription factor [Deltaproteobacteria bacterium]
MIKLIIADDEQHARERLKDLISDYEQFKIISEVDDGNKALEKMVSLKPDVAILDINMPGISVFNTISSLQAPPIIVFQTAHSKYAADAFDVEALDYLLKPVSRERFKQAVNKIMKKLSSATEDMKEHDITDKDSTTKITVRVNGTIKIIRVNDISKICFEEGLSFIYTNKDKFISDRTLNYYEEKLQEMKFFRSNRANLVNLEYVTTIHKAFKGAYYIELQDGTRIELSRRKAQILKKNLDF